MNGRKKYSLSLDDVDQEDRISKLPDTVIGHMLSFLPTKHAVGTSVLSTSWAKLWTTIHNFHFDDQLLFDPQKYPVNSRLKEKFRQQCVLSHSSLLHFVDSIFSQNKGSVLSSFYMRIRYPIEKEEFEHLTVWLHESLSRGVRQIDFKVPCFLLDLDNRATLCLNLVEHTNLEVLKLGQAFLLKIPHYVSLPNLKVLHLYSIKISVDAANRLISSSPKLEDLSFESVGLTDLSVLNIPAPALSKLVLHLYPNSKGLKIVLDAPCLTFFQFIDQSFHNYHSDLSFKCPHSIVEAQINLKNYLRQPDSVIHLMHSIAGKVQILYLHYTTLKSFTYSYHQWPQFFSLTYLEFSDAIGFNSISLGCLLNSSENLQTLVFKEGFFRDTFGYNWFMNDNLLFENEKTPAYFIRLKLISIGSFTGDESEMRGLNYLLKKAIVLEKLEICYSSVIDPSECLNLSEKLLTLPFPRNCELVVL